MSKSKRKIITIIVITIATILIILQSLIHVVSATDTVELSLIPTPYIDIVLAKGLTAVNVNNFEEDVLNALKKQGIDTNMVNISAVESTFFSSDDADASVIFNTWEKYPKISGENFQAYWQLSGNQIYTTANVHWTGFWNREAEDDSDYTIEFKVMNGNFDPLGFTFRMNEIGTNEYAFYGVELDCTHDTLTLGKITSWIPNANDQMHGGPIYHTTISAVDGYYDNYTSTSYAGALSHCEGSRLSYKNYGFNEGTWYNVKIEAYGNNIKVYINNSLIIDYTDNDNPLLDGGYGPYTASNPDGHFQTVQVNTQRTKKLEEVLRESEFRENSIKVLVNIQDNTNEQLTDPASLGELLTRTINDEIHFVGWGTDNNKIEFENFILANNENGMFTYNTDYDKAVLETAEYIKSLIDQIKSSQYIILNEPTDILSNPSDIMTDTADEDYPYGKWKIVHDCEYFENNIGQFADTNRYIPDMVTEFNKTGKYEVYYADNQVLPTEIYVHRKPMAEFEIEREGDKITLTSLGYDLDNYSNNRGISEEEWKWRQVGETEWHDGKLTDISGGTDFLVQLRVKDFQNTWSAPVSKYITKNKVLPIASFKIVNVNTSIYDELEIVDGSYDPSGGTITGWKWTVLKGESEIYSGSEPLLNYMDYGEGNYKMTLEVTNNSGQVSERVTRNFTIIPDDEAPEFMADPMNCDWTTSQDVKLTFTDRLGSGFKNYKYAITDSQEEPDTYSSPIAKDEDTITIDEDGIKYLHIIATDNAGNTSRDRVVGPYYIDKTPPTGTIDYNPKEWVIDEVVLEWNFEDKEIGFQKVTLPNGQTVEETSSGTYTVYESGTYNFEVYDKLGNHQTISIQISNIDKVNPIIALSQQEIDNWTSNNVEIAWNCIDNESGFKEILLPDGTSSKLATGKFIAEQIGTYSFVAYDNVGNKTITSIEVQSIDKIKPTLKLEQNTQEWVNEDVIISWEAEDLESGVKEVLLPNGETVQEKTGTFLATKNSTYTFTVYDNLGNTETKTIKITNIDKIAPAVTLKVINKNDKKYIKWTLADNESGVEEMLLPNGTVSNKNYGEFLIEASGTYTFVGYDKAGNSKIQKIEVII